ncbi:MAG: hypothetical protein ACYDBP_05830 [Leptospirales bacterium]
MSSVDALMKAMETPGTLDEEGLTQVRKDWFDPIVLEQHRLFAADSFALDSFYLPEKFHFHHSDKLPDFLAAFLREMHCIDFKKMTPMTRRTLWFGVRLCLGLSESDFPYPGKLKKLDLFKRESPELSIPARYRPPTGAAIGIGVILGMVLAVLLLRSSHPVSPAGHAHTAPSANSVPDYLYGLPQAERNIPSTPKLVPSPTPRMVPGSPGNP